MAIANMPGHTENKSNYSGKYYECENIAGGTEDCEKYVSPV
jgi:hypothetical protein